MSLFSIIRRVFVGLAVAIECRIDNIRLFPLVNKREFSKIRYIIPATVYSGPNKLAGIVGLDKLSTIGVGLVAAFVVIAITYATAYRSGAQINPAVTIALLVTGKIRAKEAALFIAC